MERHPTQTRRHPRKTPLTHAHHRRSPDASPTNRAQPPPRKQRPRRAGRARRRRGRRLPELVPAETHERADGDPPRLGLRASVSRAETRIQQRSHGRKPEDLGARATDKLQRDEHGKPGADGMLARTGDEMGRYEVLPDGREPVYRRVSGQEYPDGADLPGGQYPEADRDAGGAGGAEDGRKGSGEGVVGPRGVAAWGSAVEAEG